MIVNYNTDGDQASHYYRVPYNSAVLVCVISAETFVLAVGHHEGRCPFLRITFIDFGTSGNCKMTRPRPV